MPRHDPFDFISSTVNLDDPAEHDNANRFMASALARVIECLPIIAQSAALTAGQYLSDAVTADEVLAVRAELWSWIQGREQSDERDVLRIRTVICALHGMDAEAPCDKIEYFLMFWERSGLSMDQLAAAISDVYKVAYRAP